MNKLYFFHKTTYIGYFDVKRPMDLVFHRECEELDENTEFLFKVNNNFESMEEIDSFLRDRVMPPTRSDRSLYASQLRVECIYDWDILLASHCVSVMDCFWWNTEKDPSWYESHMKSFHDSCSNECFDDFLERIEY